MFKGTHQITIDTKGRFAIPSAFRQTLKDECAGHLAVTRHWDGCVLIYPYPEFQKFEQQLLAQPSLAPAVRETQRYFLGSAQDVDMDKQGRVLLPSHLRRQAGLTGKSVLVGMGRIFELWDEQLWEERTMRTGERLAQQAASGELPEVLMNISL